MLSLRSKGRNLLRAEIEMRLGVGLSGDLRKSQNGCPACLEVDSGHRSRRRPSLLFSSPLALLCSDCGARISLDLCCDALHCPFCTDRWRRGGDRNRCTALFARCYLDGSSGSRYPDSVPKPCSGTITTWSDIIGPGSTMAAAGPALKRRAQSRDDPAAINLLDVMVLSPRLALTLERRAASNTYRIGSSSAHHRNERSAIIDVEAKTGQEHITFLANEAIGFYQAAASPLAMAKGRRMKRHDAW